jgi:arylsulfatase A-like enzyme
MVLAFASSALAQSLPPNIVVILIDDLGYDNVGFNGCPDVPTPNIDSVANNGVRCTNGYVTHPLCSASRAGLITGRYQQRFGHEYQPEGDDSNPLLGLPMSEILLPEILKPAGYVSGAIGKWHLGAAFNFHPIQRGFDEFYGFLGGASHYYDVTLLRDETPVRETEYLTDAFTREGVDFINRHAAEPFFLYLAYNAVHSPYDAPPQIYLDRVSYITDLDRRNYAAMVVAVDDGVGQVLATLQVNNLLENTLVFFLSDNGAPTDAAPDGQISNNAPLRGYKSNVLEGGIRVPFAVQWNGRLPVGTVYDNPISSLDIVATAAAAAGVSLPADRVYDGLDMTPYLAGEQVSPKRTLFWRWFGLGKKYGPPGSLDTIWAVRSGRLKLVKERHAVNRPAALYNLSNDIGETTDLSATRPQDVASLTQLYNQWSTELVSPRWWQGDPAYDIRPLVLAGDWNGFNIEDSNPPWQLTWISAPAPDGTPDSVQWYNNMVHVAAEGGDTTPGIHTFVVAGADSYANQWGGVTINVNANNSIPSFSGTGLGPTNDISLEDGFYYSFRVIDQSPQPGDSLPLAVLKTSAPPVSLSQNGQTPPNPTFDDPVVVSILTNQAKSAEERIYLRWSTDFFITSQLVEAEGSETNYSATIPAQPGGAAVQYSILSSTVDLSRYSTPGVIDSLTLATTPVFKIL